MKNKTPKPSSENDRESPLQHWRRLLGLTVAAVAELAVKEGQGVLRVHYANKLSLVEAGVVAPHEIKPILDALHRAGFGDVIAAAEKWHTDRRKERAT